MYELGLGEYCVKKKKSCVKAQDWHVTALHEWRLSGFQHNAQQHDQTKWLVSTTEETKYSSRSSMRKTPKLHTLTTDHTAFLVVRLQVGGWATKFRFRFASNSHFCDFFIEQTFQGICDDMEATGWQETGKAKKRLRRVETEPAALPCGDVTTSRASQGLASCQTGRDTQLSHLVSVGDDC